MKDKKSKLLSFFLSFSLIYIALIVSGCEKENPAIVCGEEDPLNKIEWLNSMKNLLMSDSDVTSATITLYRLNDTDYILVHKTISSLHDYPDSIIYDCEGNEEYTCGGNQQVDNCSTFFANAQKIKTLWEK